MECPVCFAQIDENSEVCPICGEKLRKGNELEKTKKELDREGSTKRIILWVIIVAVIIGVIVLLCVTGAIWWIIGGAILIAAVAVWLNG